MKPLDNLIDTNLGVLWGIWLALWGKERVGKCLEVLKWGRGIHEDPGLG